MEGQMWVRMLGPVQVRGGDGWVRPAGPQVHLVLARLALSAGQVVAVDDLIDVLWAQRPPPSARASLQIMVVGLRKVLVGLPGCAVERYGDGYLLRAAADKVDVHRFRSLVCSARQAPDDDQAIAVFDQALALWRGPALSDVPATPRVEAIRAGLAEEQLSAVQDRFGCLLAAGRHQEAAAEIPLVLAGHPLAERLAGMLMIAWYRCGRQADALQVFRDLRGRLADELGVEPGPELQGLHQQILSGDPALAASGSLAGLLRGGGAAAAASGAGGDGVIWRVRPSRRGDAPEWPGSDKDAEGSERPGPREVGVEAGPGLDQPVGARGPGAQLPSGSGNARRADAGSMSAAVVPRQLPAAPAHFVGRQRELSSMTGWLDAGTAAGQTVILAIGGTAGVGKTALAVHWAHGAAGLFPDGQLYVNLRGFGPSGTPMAPAEAVRLLLDGLGVTAERIPPRLDGQVGLYRSLLAGKRMLIVADNASESGQVRPLLPGSPGCLVVVTSRSQLTGLAAADGARLLTLDLLAEAEARELLTDRLDPGRVAAEPAAVTELIRLCARLPLALSIAAARAAARPGVPLAALVAELRGAGSRLDALGTGEEATDVRAVFSWSCQQLAEQAHRMFRLLGVHPGPDISLLAAASLAGLPSAQARAVLAKLAAAHLVTEPVPGRFACHDLLRAYAAELAETLSGSERRAATLRMLDFYLHTACAAARLIHPYREPIPLEAPQPLVEAEEPASGEQAVDWFRAEREVLLAVIRLAAANRAFSAHARQLPSAVKFFLYLHGYWQEAAATQETALAAACLAGDQAAQSEAHRALGLAQVRLGAAAEGISHLSTALDLGRALDSSILQAQAHRNLGLACASQGRNLDALGHARHALRLYHAAGDRHGKANALNMIGWYNALLGHYREALHSCERAFALQREIGNRLGEAATLDSLGYAHHHLGNHARATACYQQAIDIFAEIGVVPDQAEVLTHLGDAHQAAGDTGAAQESWRKALLILDQLAHPDAEHLRSRIRRT